jgi:antimicrobial peptide system SdpA family protein
MNKIIFSFISIIVFWIGLIYCVFISSIPHNPLSLGKNYSTYIKTFFPEGWQFFTKNPRDPQILILEEINGDWKKHSLFPNSSLNNYLGLRRGSKAIGVEYGLLCETLSPSQWLTIANKNIFTYIKSDTTNSIKTINTNINPLLCGDYIFVEIEPCPWAWRDTQDKYSMPAKIIKLHIICVQD